MFGSTGLKPSTFKILSIGQVRRIHVVVDFFFLIKIKLPNIVLSIEQKNIMIYVCSELYYIHSGFAVMVLDYRRILFVIGKLFIVFKMYLICINICIGIRCDP